MSKPAHHRSGNPAKRAAVTKTGHRPADRSRSWAVLAWLQSQPRWLVPVLIVAFTFGGMFLPAIPGGLCLLAVAAFLGWLASLSWPRLSKRARAGRLLMIGAVAGVAVARIAGIWVA